MGRIILSALLIPRSSSVIRLKQLRGSKLKGVKGASDYLWSRRGPLWRPKFRLTSIWVLAPCCIRAGAEVAVGYLRLPVVRALILTAGCCWLTSEFCKILAFVFGGTAFARFASLLGGEVPRVRSTLRLLCRCYRRRLVPSRCGWMPSWLSIAGVAPWQLAFVRAIGAVAGIFCCVGFCASFARCPAARLCTSVARFRAFRVRSDRFVGRL